MPVNGLPIMLERILNAVLQDSTVSSYKFAAQNGPRSTIVIRFDSDSTMADSGVVQPGYRSTPALPFRRKSPSQIRRDERRRSNHRFNKDTALDCTTERETEQQTQDQDNKAFPVGDSQDAGAIQHSTINTSTPQILSTSAATSLDHRETPHSFQTGDSGITSIISSKSAIDTIGDTDTTHKQTVNNSDLDLSPPCVSNTSGQIKTPATSVFELCIDRNRISTAANSTDSTHSVISTDSNSESDSYYESDTDNHEMDEKKEEEDEREVNVNSAECETTNKASKQQDNGDDIDDNIFRFNYSMKNFICDYIDNEFAELLKNVKRNKCVKQMTLVREIFPNTILAATDDLIIEYCTDKEKVTKFSLNTADSRYLNYYGRKNWSYMFEHEDDTEFIKQNHKKHVRNIQASIPQIIQLTKQRPADAKTLREINLSKSRNKEVTTD